jgi:hypothetical protein
MRRWTVLLVTGALLLAAGTPIPAQEGRRTRNVVLVLIDGLRWQEVFTGAEEALMSKEAGGVKEPEALRKAFWRETPEARRAAMMPWLWETVARRGQLYGNRLAGSAARVTNRHHFSYPGYHEMIAGFEDPAIDSNAKKPNKHVSVFEWLHGRPGYRGQVAVFGTWDVVDSIINKGRCGFPVYTGFAPVTSGRISARLNLLNQLKVDLPRPWDHSPYDALAVHSAIEYLRENRTRAMWITVGETDEYAHAGRYDQYLDAAHRTDGLLRTLWDALQAHGDYRDRTTLMFAVDHGRGVGPEWTSHSAKYRGSDEIWLGAIGPDTPPLGERRNIPEVTQSQIPATLAALLGEDYRAFQPRAALPIRGLLPTD